jgi:hypothetical protein
MRVAIATFLILYVPFATGFRVAYADSNGAYNVLTDPLWIPILLIASFMVLAGSIFPDELEPARHWTHRAKWHSSRWLVRFSILVIVATFISAVFPEVLLISGFFFGYVIHLAMDSQTKMGLPS